MSIRTMLSGNRPEIATAEVPRACGHWDLAPRWGCNEDIGKEALVTFYTCATCGETFSKEDAAAPRRTS